MTIYILDNYTKKISEYLDDKSLEIMIKDIIQVLCNVCYWKSTFGNYEKIPYKYFKKDVPLKPKVKPNYLWEWSQWASTCKANCWYLIELLDVCLLEYAARFTDYEEDKYFKFYQKYALIVIWTRENVPDLPQWVIDSSRTTVYDPKALPLVMPKKYIVYQTYEFAPKEEIEIIESYRNYYLSKIKAKYFKLEKQGYIDSIDLWTKRSQPIWLKL